MLALPPAVQSVTTHTKSESSTTFLALQPFPFLCLKPCFAPAPFLLKPALALRTLDLKDLSFLFPSNLFFPNFFSLSPALFAPNVFPPPFTVFFLYELSPSLVFHPFPVLSLDSFPLEGVCFGDLPVLSFLAVLPGDGPFLFLAEGNMSAQKS